MLEKPKRALAMSSNNSAGTDLGFIPRGKRHQNTTTGFTIPLSTNQHVMMFMADKKSSMKPAAPLQKKLSIRNPVVSMRSKTQSSKLPVEEGVANLSLSSSPGDVTLRDMKHEMKTFTDTTSDLLMSMQWFYATVSIPTLAYPCESLCTDLSACMGYDSELLDEGVRILMTYPMRKMKVDGEERIFVRARWVNEDTAAPSMKWILAFSTDIGTGASVRYVGHFSVMP